MSKLLKDPMGDGSKFWAGDILTSLGLTVDEAVTIEHGSNSNGYYIKFGNGLLICYGSVNISSTSGTGDHKYGTAVFPMDFINNNYSANITPNASGIANFGAYSYSDAKTNQMGIWCTRRSTADIAMSYQVFGHWK